MKKLAIIGHPLEGNKVIEILEMLGGKNKDGDGWKCKNPQLAYYIDDTGWIEFINTCNPNENILRYTLEEFLEKFPYKVGDKVLYYENPVFITQMEWIEDSVSYHFYYKGRELMLPVNHLQPYKEETMEEIKIDIPKGYEFTRVDDDKQQVVFTKIQPQYPKTYEECCEVLFPTTIELGKVSARGYNGKLLEKFGELLICRDAYWKIAGEEMRLGKPWEPDFKDDSDKYFICYLKDKIWKSNIRDCNRFLVFPTEEMRDTFYENFKELIEDCKNLI